MAGLPVRGRWALVTGRANWPLSGRGAPYFYEQEPGDDQTDGQAGQRAGRQDEGGARPACGQGKATSRGSQAASKDKGQAARQFPGPPAGGGFGRGEHDPRQDGRRSQRRRARVQATGRDVRVGNKAMRP
jgi:hypothetical protein